MFALFGFIFTLLFSLSVNVWQTSIIRGAIGFFVFFLIAYLFRFIWEFIHSGGTSREVGHRNQNDSNKEINKDESPVAKETSDMIRSLLKEDEKNQK